jgi:hypothetical protein
LKIYWITQASPNDYLRNPIDLDQYNPIKSTTYERHALLNPNNPINPWSKKKEFIRVCLQKSEKGNTKRVAVCR